MKPKNREETLYLAVVNGLIEIRPDGSIWRVARRHKSRWDGKITVTPVAPRRIDASVGAGYRLVKIMIDGVQTTALAHRLVWRAIKGPIPPGLTINHKNGIKSDNSPDNLELATYSEQVVHALNVLRVGRIDQNGQRNAMSKLNDAAVREIRRRRKSGELLWSIAKDFGITYQTVSKICRGDRWAFLG